VQGAPAVPRIINAEGLKRRGFSPEDIKAIQFAFKTLYKKKLSLADAILELKKQAEKNPHVKVLYESVAHANRNIVR
ncbi:MAG: acyl-[acyl-carrier-protein]--UDP-N-acetylglucosamine O-acyltransferase, partial [Pseudomonadales bacterium]